MAGFKRGQGEEMGVGQIGDVDVVADAGAVGGGIVVAVDADGGAAAQGHIEDEGNQMGLGFVGFAAGDAAGAFGCAGHIEVAQGGEAEAMNAVKPGEHVFDQQLGFAVSIGGLEAGIFSDGNGFRLAIDGGGGGEDDACGARRRAWLQADSGWRQCYCGNKSPA